MISKQGADDDLDDFLMGPTPAARVTGGAAGIATPSRHEDAATAAAATEQRLRAELANMEARLAEAEEARAREKDSFEEKMLELRQKTSDKMKQIQEKMKDVVAQKDQKIQECETERVALAAQLANVGGSAAHEVQEENSRSRSEMEAKLSEVVRKTKEHVKQIQTRLETTLSENKELLERCKELEEQQGRSKGVDDAFKQQQEKVAKYKQLMAQANARIEESDTNVRELRDALSKAQSQRMTLQEQMGSMEKSFSIAPSSEEIARRGGILLAVESDHDDVWCLINEATEGAAAGGAASDAGATDGGGCASDASVNQRWWLLSQLDVEDKPIPLQRRWKGEVSALRAQMLRFKKKGEDLQDEFNAYRQKANAALKSGALQGEEAQRKERKLEELGEQLHATNMELKQSQTERTQAVAELGDVRKRFQEVSSHRSELERTLERQVREASDAKEAAIEKYRLASEAKRESVEQEWSEKERSYQEKISLMRTQKEALDEEVEGLRTRLASRPASVTNVEAEAQAIPELPPPPPPQLVTPIIPVLAATPPAFATPAFVTMASDSGTGAGVTSSATGVSVSAEASATLRIRDRSVVAALPLSEAVQGAGGNVQAPPMSARSAASSSGAASSLMPGPPGVYSLHEDVTRQDLASLRCQVRRLELSLQEAQNRTLSIKKEHDRTQQELREVTQQQHLQGTVGQHQQMEYIRNVFRKFVETLPVGCKEHEQLLPVLMTFFKFQDEELKMIQGKRQKASGSWNPLSKFIG